MSVVRCCRLTLTRARPVWLDEWMSGWIDGVASTRCRCWFGFTVHLECQLPLLVWLGSPLPTSHLKPKSVVFPFTIGLFIYFRININVDLFVFFCFVVIYFFIYLFSS